MAPFSLLQKHDCQVLETKKTSTEFNPRNVKILKGHESEVFVCSWNPKLPLLGKILGILELISTRLNLQDYKKIQEISNY